MSINFPTSLDSLPNPTSTDLLENAVTALDHDQQHSNANDAIEALQAKVGANSSVVNTSHDYKLSEVGTGDKAVSKTATQTITNKTLTSPQINFGSDARGDLIVRNSSGTTSRLPVGSAGQILTANSSGDPQWTANPTASNTNYAADTGAANAYVVTLSPALGAYTAGVLVQFKATNANTTTSTVNVNGLGVQTIKKLGGTDLASGDISAGMIVELEYDGTNFQMLNPVGNAPVTLVAGVYPAGSATNLTNVPLPAKNGTFTISASGTTTITTNFQPRHITLHHIGSAGGGAGVSMGGYDATSATMWCCYSTYNANGGITTASSNTTEAVHAEWGTNPAATTATVTNITSTGFDVVKSFGSVTAVVYWTAI